MIKGVNHNVVEITGMENDYFERAVLYIRPGKSGVSQSRIELEARCAVGKFVPQEKLCRRAAVFTSLTIKLICAAVIMLSAAAIAYFILC